jgi:predicted tellurium resistance membrane protein TerC
LLIFAIIVIALFAFILSTILRNITLLYINLAVLGVIGYYLHTTELEGFSSQSFGDVG